MSSRAWVDDLDRAAARDAPAFLSQSAALPAWATAKGTETERETERERERAAPPRKRFRDADLDALLSRTDPLLSTGIGIGTGIGALPPVLSVLPLPRDAARTIHWHRSGQLAVVGGNRHVYLFHAAGRFVERLAKTEVPARVERTALGATGEDLVVVGHQRYAPDLLILATERVVPLNFLDTRDSAAYRNGRRDNGKQDFYITNVATQLRDPDTRTIAVASGATVCVGSLASGSIVHSIALNDPVVDVAFTGARELTVATRGKLLVYDLRKSARVLRETSDDGTLDVTTFATNDTSFAVGSASGVVSVYSRGTAGPVKTLKNLTTSINHIAFGQRSNGDTVLAYSTGSQKGGFRLAVFPECRVMASFPAVAQRHQFIQSLTIAPTIPVLSVGERQKVTNYAL